MTTEQSTKVFGACWCQMYVMLLVPGQEEPEAPTGTHDLYRYWVAKWSVKLASVGNSIIDFNNRKLLSSYGSMWRYKAASVFGVNLDLHSS